MDDERPIPAGNDEPLEAPVRSRRYLLSAACFLIGAAAVTWRAVNAPGGDAWLLSPFVGVDLVAAAVALRSYFRRPVGYLPWVGYAMMLCFFWGYQGPLVIPHALAGWLATRPARRYAAPYSPEEPHRYTRGETAWMSDLLPIGWTTSTLGALQRESGGCRWCGQGREDRRHWVRNPEEGEA